MEEILQLYELQYSDLKLLLSDTKPTSHEEIERLQVISKSIIQNLGPSGPGLLSINGFPKSQILRQTLLPMARKLALLNNDDRKRILKMYNLGSDVSLKNPDRIVSSFAMNLKFDEQINVELVDKEMIDEEFKVLGFAFRELGICMMELGLFIARVCDKILGGCELEQSLLQCGTAKARLIHYHSVNDNVIIKASANHRKGSKKLDVRLPDLWQEWHYDYGVFTMLTAPMFMLSKENDEKECESPSGHTYLKVFHPEMNREVMVKASKGSCIVQVGESADLLTKGKLRATLHCVGRPNEMDSLSRETFVVFLQPAWNKIFSLLDYPQELLSENESEVESNGLTRKVREIVPPLSSRLRDGMTFAEFSRETTRQYYGGRGLQSNK